ncbi:hypothetical protein CSC81_18205, partial [Tenacibaculum discolor]
NLHIKIQNRYESVGFFYVLWALPKGRAFRTRFLFVPHKRAQTNATIDNADLLAVLFTTRNQLETLFL